MGSELTCPCSSKMSENEDPSKKKILDDNEKIMQGRLSEEDIIYQYSYGNTKIYIVKTENIEKFFNTRSMLKLTTNKQVIFIFL